MPLSTRAVLPMSLLGASGAGHWHCRRQSSVLVLPVASPHICDVNVDRAQLKHRRVLHAEFDFGFRRTSPQLGSGPTQRPTNGHMKPALSALAATIALALGGCGLEAARPTILVQNNSDQVIVLQAKVDGRVVPKATAMPHTKERSMNSPLEGRCVNNWEIVDENGRLLKKVDQLCAYDTVVYP